MEYEEILQKWRSRQGIKGIMLILGNSGYGNDLFQYQGRKVKSSLKEDR